MTVIPDGMPEELPLTTASELAANIRSLCLSTTLRLGEMVGALEIVKMQLWTEAQADDWPQAED